jgi:hypothetical protein
MPQLSTVRVVLPVVWNYKTEMVHVIGFQDSEGFPGRDRFEELVSVGFRHESVLAVIARMHPTRRRVWLRAQARA